MNNPYQSNLKDMPMSVKFPHVTRARVKRASELLGYSMNKVVCETVEQTLSQVDNPEAETVPEILGMLRLVLAQKQNPTPRWNHHAPPEAPPQGNQTTL